MANAVFTTSEGTAYDDQPEVRYHFPETYIRQAREAEGDWILYYEPRRIAGPASSGGRQAYFATAWVEGIQRDPLRADHYYAFLKHYMEFDAPVPFREGQHYFEKALAKADGSTNKGAFGRAVRIIPKVQFEAIVSAGFVQRPDDWELDEAVSDQVPEYEERPIVERLVSRKFRDAAFCRHVRRAYSNMCAVTGLHLVNGGGRPEVQAAHIRPVEKDGPDTVRNGIALTGTVHWLFDRGLISIDDSHKLLLSPLGVPEAITKLMQPDRGLILPANSDWHPHRTYLAWHRENVFKK